MSDLTLEVRGLSKRWRGFELRDVNLTVDDGEYFAPLGPNGAGKTLLLETILGFYKPDSGKVLVGGEEITDLPPDRRGFGYVPQNASLFPHLSVRDNIEYGLLISKVPETERRRRSDELLKLTKLEDLANRRPNTLSGGEKQKTALVRALAKKPKVLILDEPLIGIDEENRHGIQEELRKIHSETGITTIHVTHDHSEAYSLSDRMAIIRGGSIVQTGTPEEIYRNPVDAATASFLGFENILTANPGIEPGEVEIKGTRLAIPTPRNLKCIVCIRGEEINLSRNPQYEGMNTKPGRIIDVRTLGNVFVVKVDIGFEIKATLSRREYFALGGSNTHEIFVTIPLESIRIFEGNV